MSLLALERVTKRHVRGGREVVALRAVSLEVEPGELVAIWGRRRSGRTSLLRVAGGLDRPDEGAVSYDGRDLGRADAPRLGAAIGYAQPHFNAYNGQSVADQVAIALLAHGVPLTLARTRAHTLLTNVGARACAELDPRALDPAETVRVMVARALIAEPRLLIVDEPTQGVDLLERDGILRLLRSIADRGVAVLMSTGETTDLSGADRALSIADGEMHGKVVLPVAPVVPLRRLPARNAQGA